MKTLRIVFPFVSSLFLASVSASAHEAHHHLPSAASLDENRPPALSGESIYNLADTWRSQDGRDVKISSLAGGPVVVAMVYTSCQSACPMTVADLKRIEAAIPIESKTKVRFAIFSFDSKRDSPEKLAEFAKSRSLESPRWTLFHGSKGAVRKLAAVLGIQYKEDRSGNFDHSNVITLVDSGGVIRHQQVGLGKEPKEMAARIEEVLAQSGAGKESR